VWLTHAPHCPSELQTSGAVHEPHVPPQPSLPQVFPSQDGAQQVFAAVQISVPVQVPQVPPHPSLPHVFPEHEGTQFVETHWSLRRTYPASQPQVISGEEPTPFQVH